MNLIKIISGSRALRVADENSDFDSIEIVMPTLAQMAGLEPFKHSMQKIVGNKDTRTYSLPHFAKQVLAGNSNFVQALWFPVEYTSSIWQEMIEPYRDTLFNRAVFAFSAIHVANALLAKGTGKASASGIAMLLFATNVLWAKSELPYSHTDYQIIQNFRANGGWIDRKLVEYLMVEIKNAETPEFDKKEAVHRFTTAMRAAMRAEPKYTKE